MHTCCTAGDSGAPTITTPATPVRTWRGRLAAFVQWALPVTILALIPKCPVCIAGYVLLFTGIGLSLPAAATIRWTLIALCVLALITLAVRALSRARTSS